MRFLMLGPLLATSLATGLVSGLAAAASAQTVAGFHSVDGTSEQMTEGAGGHALQMVE
jgi:hypothetical protein